MISFKTNHAALQRLFDSAAAGLAANCIPIGRNSKRVLTEGGEYPGIWLECGPHESLLYADFDRDIAVNGHEIFFDHQNERGQLPPYILDQPGWGQIQMVVPIARTAMELFAITRDHAFLCRAYDACAQWDLFLSRYRNTRRSGLCEMFCLWDTGHDKSPRLHAPADHCPDHDATRYWPNLNLPFLAPDLSATLYGGRIALAHMANILGRQDAALEWMARADRLRSTLLKMLFDPHDCYFYDLDARGKFVRLRGDALTRVLSEVPLERTLFDQIYHRHIRNPQGFWTPYPLPSVAINDPLFDNKLPSNSWGGASQALTALRSYMWFERYGKFSDHRHLMSQWLRALCASGRFEQQLNPWTGESCFSHPYTPAMLCATSFVARLFGVVLENNTAIWNCHLPPGAAQAEYRVERTEHSWLLQTENTQSRILIDGQCIATLIGHARLVTTPDGRPLQIINTTSEPVQLSLSGDQLSTGAITLKPNEICTLAGSRHLLAAV